MSFLKQYVKDAEHFIGIKGLQMNAPYVPLNHLAEIGIEVEIEGARLPGGGAFEKTVAPKSKAVWTAKADHSLRNGGIEYVVSQPVHADEVDYMVDGLWEGLKAHRARIDVSNRCSTHVHINVGGKKINELTSVIALWTTLEESLVNWCGEDRTNNHFCLSSKDQLRLIENWDRVLQKGRVDWSEGMKYSALNMRTMRDLGSIEFRTMRLDEDSRPIKDWVKFINGMAQYAFRRYDNPQLIAADLSERQGDAVFLEICNESNVSDLFPKEVLSHPLNADFNRMAFEGFRRAQPLILGYPWHEWMPEINKEYVPTPFGKKKSGDPGLEMNRIRVDPLRGDPFGDRPRRGRVEPFEPEVPVNPGNPVDLNRPIEFGDGTPAVVVANGRRGDRTFLAMSEGGVGLRAWGRGSIRANYYVENGQWEGSRLNQAGFPWIRNVEVDEDEGWGEPEPEPDVPDMPQPAPVAAPRAVPAVPINPGNRAPNLDFPIEYGDGTPAEVTDNLPGGTTFGARPVPGNVSWAWPELAVPGIAYRKRDGSWSGAPVDSPTYPWIKNTTAAILQMIEQGIRP